MPKLKEANELSDDEKRGLINKSLTAKYGMQKEQVVPHDIWVEDVFENEIVFRVNDKLYKASYTFGEGEELKIGEGVEVEKKTTYEPLESLRTTYTDIIQEAGRRNANLDSSRIKKIVELCQELLSSEGMPDEKAIKKAAKEASSVLTWIQDQSLMKVEEDVKYPVEAYAYAPEADNPESWRLRLWETPELKVTRSSLSKAAALLSPGGYSGQEKVVITDTGSLYEAKLIIRDHFRNMAVPEDEIPKWVKESEEKDKAIIFTPLTEATINKGRASVTIIKPGFNATKERYYPAEVLKRDYAIFEGQKMYADHPTEAEDKARPERSIKDWVATLVDVSVDESGVVSGIAEVIEPWLETKLANLRDKKMLSEMGISINAVGNASKATIDGTPTLRIEKLIAARSVDFVTEPGAGGVVTFFEADRDTDVDLVSLSALKESRPDLIKAIESEVKAEIKREVKLKMAEEEKVKELATKNEEQATKITEQATKITELETTITEAAKLQEKADAQATIKVAVDKAELHETAKARIMDTWKESTTAEGIEEAIKSEKDYVAKLTKAGEVKGLGPTEISTEKSRKNLKEAFKKANPDWSEEQLDNAVSGR